MNSAKEAHKLQKETRDLSNGPGRNTRGRSTADALRYRYAILINKKYTMVHALRSEYADSGLSEATQQVVR